MTGDAWGAVLSVVVAADAPAAADSSNGPLVVLLVAGGTVFGTIATALGPTFVEIAKNRGKRPGASPAEGSGPSPPTPAIPPLPASPGNALTAVVGPGIDALSMINAAVMDYREQRDKALTELSAARNRLEQAGRMIMDQRVLIGQLEEQINGAPRGNSRHALRDGSPDDRWL